MRVLGVGAHPDDLELLCGGTLAKYAKRGDEVTMAVVTNGEVGSETLSKEEIARIRRDEAKEAAAVIGAEFIWMDFPDEFLFDSKEARLKFIDVLRQARPDVVLAHFPSDYHPDHSISGQIVYNVKMMITVPNIKTEHPPCKKIPEIYYMDTLAGINFQPYDYVDISDTFETKREMLSKHRSQGAWLEKFGMSYIEFMEIVARFRGIQSGVRYAEAFSRPQVWPKGTLGNLLP
ncbi:MAG: PIG-L deacetylase family protein [bacterium]